jgi:hypothetical protein
MALFEKLQEVYPKCRIQEDKNYASFSLGGAFVYELRIQKGSIRLLASNYPAKASFGECFKIIKQYKIEGKLINGHKLIFEAGLRNASKLTLRIEIPFKEGDLAESQFINSVINSCEKFHNVLLPLVSNFQKEPIGSLRELMSESKPIKKMEADSTSKSLQSQIADEILKKYKDAVIKKIDSDNYLDIHLPAINEKRGTHLGINTAKNVIRMVFYCRDFDFVQKALANSSLLEEYSQGLRPLGDPSFKNVKDAVEAIFGFLSEINTINSKGTSVGTQVLSKVSAENKPKESTTYTFQKAVDAYLQGNIDYVAAYVQAGNPVLQFNGDTLITNELISYVSAFMEVDQWIADLVESGVDLDASFDNGEGYTAVHFAAWDGKDEILAYLLEAGAEADSVGEDGYTPLFLAAAGGHLDCVEILVENGADVNRRLKDSNIYFSKQGGTPLTVAFINGFLGMALYLIDQGADPFVLKEPCQNAPSPDLFVNFSSLLKQGAINLPREGQLETILSLVSKDGEESDEEVAKGTGSLDLNDFLAELESDASEEESNDEEEEDTHLDEMIKKFVEYQGSDKILEVLDEYYSQKGDIVVVEIDADDLINTLSTTDNFVDFVVISGIIKLTANTVWADLAELIGESEVDWVKTLVKEENPDTMVLFYCEGKYVYAFSNINANENINGEDTSEEEAVENKGISDLTNFLAELEAVTSEEESIDDESDEEDSDDDDESEEEEEDSDEDDDESDEEDEEEEGGFPMISYRKPAKEMVEVVQQYLRHWQKSSQVYAWRMGIKAFIPEFVSALVSDKVCPIFTTKDIEAICSRINSEKIIPILGYVPEDFYGYTKRVWWLVPFCIWKEDTASFVFIDKNGFYGMYSQDGEEKIDTIFNWDSVDELDFEYAYDGDPNINRLTLTQEDGNFLTFDEFVSTSEEDDHGSYLAVIEAIWEARRETIEASKGEPFWAEGAGGEGFVEFETPQDLLKAATWDNPDRPDPSMY